MATWMPEARYFCPCGPRGECADFTFMTVVSLIGGSPWCPGPPYPGESQITCRPRPRRCGRPVTSVSDPPFGCRGRLLLLQSCARPFAEDRMLLLGRQRARTCQG